MFNAVFDHYTIKVADLNHSVEFYQRVLGLQEITNHTRKEYIRWLAMGDGAELHVVEGDHSQISKDVGIHLALRLRNFDNFITHLEKTGCTPHNSKGEPGKITTRADGIRQVYFPDPDGYWIEINEAAILDE